jgi:hypothetical protein
VFPFGSRPDRILLPCKQIAGDDDTKLDCQNRRESRSHQELLHVVLLPVPNDRRHPAAAK